jgi:hypothetical protein
MTKCLGLNKRNITHSENQDDTNMSKKTCSNIEMTQMLELPDKVLN